MCTVSAVIDSSRERFAPLVQPGIWPPLPQVTREEHEKLRRDLEALRELILAAQKADKKMGMADCEMEEKVDFLKKVAELLEVDLSEVWPE